jgi:hypothetical protein
VALSLTFSQFPDLFVVIVVPVVDKEKTEKILQNLANCGFAIPPGPTGSSS